MAGGDDDHEVHHAALSALLAASLLAPARAHSEEAEVNAFSVVRSNGTVLRVGGKLNSFVGVLQGPLYIETPEGPIHAGEISCLATLEIRSADRAHQGNGRCLLTTADRGEVYGVYTCSSYFLIGCSGTFTITGGSGRLEGISGSGRMTVRTRVGQLTGASAVSRDVEVEGIVFWRDLKYKLP